MNKIIDLELEGLYDRVKSRLVPAKDRNPLPRIS